MANVTATRCTRSDQHEGPALFGSQASAARAAPGSAASTTLQVAPGAAVPQAARHQPNAPASANKVYTASRHRRAAAAQQVVLQERGAYSWVIAYRG